MKISKAGVDDVTKVAPLFDQYRQFYGQKADLEAAQDFLRRRMASEESVVFLVYEGGAVVGFVQLYPSYSSVSLKRLWILNDLFVVPEARRKSVARALLHAAEDFARETEAKALTLKTAINNAPARRLYESAGWKRDEDFFQYKFLVSG